MERKLGLKKAWMFNEQHNSAEDFREISQIKWSCWWNPNGGTQWEIEASQWSCRGSSSCHGAPEHLSILLAPSGALIAIPTYYWLALFDMPNLNRFDILSISIFCKIALSITISISIFSKITISISIAISIFLELPYRYRYRYFLELPYRYRYRYRYFQLLHIDIDIDIFQKCRYIDNRYFLSIF